MRNGAIVEGSGRWTGHSRQDHPDYAWYPASRGQENVELVFGMAQKLADLASDAATTNRAPFRSAWRRWRTGTASRARTTWSGPPPPRASARRELFVQNPALPDLGAHDATRHFRGVRSSVRSQPARPLTSRPGEHRRRKRQPAGARHADVAARRIE